MSDNEKRSRGDDLVNKTLVSMTAEESAAWFRGEGNWLSHISDPDLKHDMLAHQRLTKQAMFDAIELFAKAWDTHSEQSARLLRQYAERARAGDAGAASQAWNYINEQLQIAWTPIS